jgi:prolyl-tRNA synthetase
MGALVMAHSDNNGLVLPPKLAPLQVVIVPIYKSEEEFKMVSERAEKLCSDLRELNITVKFDNRDSQRPGFKFAEWELKGVPVRLAIGPKDYENNTWEVARRDTLEKSIVSNDEILQHIKNLLDDIQKNIFKKALDFRTANTHKVDDWNEFKRILETSPGFIEAHWDGTPETEEAIKNETKATIRFIPTNPELEDGKCIYSGKPSKFRVIFAKSY